MDEIDAPRSKSFMQALSVPSKTSSHENEATLRQMASLISRLLSHYWTGDDPEASRRAQIEDWLLDLRSFGPEILSVACGQWRIREHRRPTIADLHKLCVEERDLRRPPDEFGAEAAEAGRRRREINERRRQAYYSDLQREGRAMINAWAQRQGHSDIDAYAAAKGIPWVDAYVIGIKEIVAEAAGASEHKPVRGFNSMAAALGVTAREYSPEEMSASRQQLGIEEN